jgi:hypothetical protein
MIDFKGRDSACFRLAKAEMVAPKREAGASSRTPYVVFYEIKSYKMIRKSRKMCQRNRVRKATGLHSKGVVIQAAGYAGGAGLQRRGWRKLNFSEGT